eukprot:m.158876 g.158876  ORF g.158876 m.158876 type:complete len:836 (+) comp31112_c0_seq2:109-2616(+)
MAAPKTMISQPEWIRRVSDQGSSVMKNMGRTFSGRQRSVPRMLLAATAVLLAISGLYMMFSPQPSLRDVSRHGVDMVGKTIQVYWSEPNEWYRARVMKYNVASTHDSKLEGKHTLVYDDESVQHVYLHKTRFHVVYGKELVGHSISIYRSHIGLARIANVTAYDDRQMTHSLLFDDGGDLDLNLALEEFEIIYGYELVGRILQIAREFRDEPLYASVLHYSEYKGTFVLGFADGSIEQVDLKGVAFELIHNHAAEIQQLRDSRSQERLNLIPEIEVKTMEEVREERKQEEAAVSPYGGRVPGGGGFGTIVKDPNDPLRSQMLEFISEYATPGQVAILNQARKHFERGLQGKVKRDLDTPIKWFPCAHENGVCNGVDYCARDNKITVRFGHVDHAWVEKVFALSKFPLTCGIMNFGTDPAVGKTKYCELLCDRGEDELKIVDSCSRETLPFIHEVARMPFCESSSDTPTSLLEEKTLQSAIKPFCKDPTHRPGMVMQLDCQYQAAYKKFANTQWTGTPTNTDWIDKAWVTFFAGAPGGQHSGMVTNLIQSIHMFSKFPVIVFSVNTTSLTADWNSETFPRLLVIHTNSISELNGGRKGVSFNFNKFRSMMIRVKVGIQLDADMIMGKNCDRLFEATRNQINEQYPYPIMPVHWMTRMKGADGYSDSYPVIYDKFRLRWAHAHPTWTFHAIPFVADALLAKINMDEWSTQMRIRTNQAVEPIPKNFLSEDEDLLNVLLWRNNATKQWCKWDIEPALYEDFMTLNTNQPTYSDTKWYKNGIPLVFVGMHNTKDPIATDKLLGRMRREGVSNNYVYHSGTYFSNPFDVEKLDHVFCLAF